MTMQKSATMIGVDKNTRRKRRQGAWEKTRRTVQIELVVTQDSALTQKGVKTCSSMHRGAA